MMFTIVSDSSSLILLAKADLLALLCEFAHMFTTEAVSEEVLFDSPDSRLIQRLIDTREITIQRTKGRELPVSLDRGEKTAILLFREMGADYLLLDDKKAALYCRRTSIPYMNALLIPLYLRRCKAIDDRVMEEKIELLGSIGRYAPWIKDYVSQNIWLL